MKTKRIQELEKLILHHKERYYRGSAEISDEKYDKLEDELKKLDEENPVLKLVGFKQSEALNKVQHQKRMLSLDKTYDQKDLLRWMGHEKVISVFKIDGSSCSVVYQDGHLAVAKTRGDGQFGENITRKAVFIPDIPKHLAGNKNIEVRGEVYCVESNFIRLTKEMMEMSLETPTSQRNIVAGLLGRKENIQLCRFLSFKAFDVISDEKFKAEHEKLDFLRENGFSIPEYEVHSTVKEVDRRINQAKDFMSSGDYLIDGLVFIYDDLKIHNELGETSHHPRYKLAFKFQGDTKVVAIREIEWGVSRTGTLTPVALVEPTELSGAMIGRVTLHNFGLAQNFQLRAGDRIEIIRSGEVIPKFMGVVEKSKGEFVYPKSCPSCRSKLIIEDIWLYCANEKCPSKVKEVILNYIHKAGIDDLSDKRLEEMINKGIITDIPDLYRITMDDLLVLDKVKEKLAKKIFENIQKTKKQNLIQFISAIGVEGISTAKSEKIISQGYNSIEKMQSLTLEKMLQIEGFAEKSSSDFLASFGNKKKLIADLIGVGVKLESEETHREGMLSGSKFCITGELSVPRSEMEKIIKMNGGMMVSSVSKNTSFLITNEEDGSSSKLLKAKSLGIPVLNENKLMKMIKG